jgi:hypothetical protein
VTVFTAVSKSVVQSDIAVWYAAMAVLVASALWPVDCPNCLHCVP